MELIASLPQTNCKVLGNAQQRDAIYTSRLCIGKNKFVCTLNIFNPVPKDVSASGHKINGITFFVKGTYSFDVGTSVSGLPKLVAHPSTLVPNAVFINFSVPRNEQRMRWAKIDEEILRTGKGFIVNDLDEYPAKFIGVLPINALIKLKTSKDEILKILTVKAGGVYEEI